MCSSGPASDLVDTAFGRPGAHGARAGSAGWWAWRARPHGIAGGRAGAAGPRTGGPAGPGGPALRCAAECETDSPGVPAGGVSGPRVPRVDTDGAIHRTESARFQRTDRYG